MKTTVIKYSMKMEPEIVNPGTLPHWEIMWRALDAQEVSLMYPTMDSLREVFQCT